MKQTISALAFGLAVVALTADPRAQTPPQASELSAMATAIFIDAGRRTIGEARLRQTPHGILVKIDLTNATPGVHGLHLHVVGSCDAPAFESAGVHFSPSGRKLGFLNPEGPHAGDLPNVDAPATKRLSVEYYVADVTLDPGPRSLLDANGSALVIHAGKDDYVSNPSGESGDRMACARIMR